MKKIVFVVNSLGNGGAQRVLGLLAASIKNREYKVKVLCVNKVEKEYVFEGVDVSYLNINSADIKKFKRIKLLKKHLKAEQPDIIIAFEYFLNMDTIIAARGLKAKVIVSERNDPARQKDRKIVNFLRNYLYKKANILVCQTPEAKAYFPDKIQRHTVVIPNPIKSGLPEWEGQNSKTIINFCRLEKQKNLPLLIDAFELLYKKDNQARLVIYGDGKEGAALEEIIKNKNLDTVVHIYPAVAIIHEVAAKCKIFVSSSDYEGLSNSMLEAMAMGMPVICTDCPCGGARMVIDNGENGLLVPVKNVQALYEAMFKVVNDIKFAEKISVKAAEIKEKLNEQKIAEEWIKLLG